MIETLIDITRDGQAENTYSISDDQADDFICERHQLEFSDLKQKHEHLEIHFTGSLNPEEKHKVIEIVKQITEVYDLSEMDRDIIYNTYQEITDLIPSRRKGSVYFPGKINVTLLKAFRTNPYLRKRYIIEYKDLVRLLQSKGISKNRQVNNYALELINFDYRKYRYSMDDYANLYWGELLNTEYFISRLGTSDITPSQYKKFLQKLVEFIDTKYLSKHSTEYIRSKFSHVLNLFILGFELISFFKIGKEMGDNSKVEEIREQVFNVIMGNKMMIGDLESIYRRFTYDKKFKKLKLRIMEDKEQFLTILDKVL